MSGNNRFVWKRSDASASGPVASARVTPIPVAPMPVAPMPVAPSALVKNKYKYKRQAGPAPVPFAMPPAAVMDPPVAGSVGVSPAPLKKRRSLASSAIEPFSMKSDVFELNTSKLFFNHDNCYCSLPVKMSYDAAYSIRTHFTKYNWVKDFEYENPKSPYHVSLIHPSFASVRGRPLSEIVSEVPKTKETLDLLVGIKAEVNNYILGYEHHKGPITVSFPATKRLPYATGGRTAVAYEAQFSDPVFMPGLKAHLSTTCDLILSPEQSFHMTIAIETKREPAASAASAPATATVFVAGAGAGAAPASARVKPFVPGASAGFSFR